MKKHLIAAAVAAAVAAPAAFAQSNVEIYGVIDQGWTTNDVDLKLRGTVGATAVSAKSSTDTETTGNASAYTSQRLGFRGSEDLGNGLKANFVIEFSLGAADQTEDRALTVSNDVATPNNLRQANAGISGGFGSIKVGRMTNFADMAWGTGDTGGQNNFLGRAYTVARTTNARSDRLIEYVSPNFNGFTVGLQYGKRDTDTKTTAAVLGTTFTAADTKSDVTETGLMVRYSAGPLNVMLGYQDLDVKTDASATVGRKRTRTNTIVGANYNFGPATVFALYNDGDSADKTNATPATAGVDKTKSDNKVYEIGVRVPAGAWTFQASYFDWSAKSKESDIATAPRLKSKGDGDGYQLAALYSMSKRTTLYAVYGSYDLTNKLTIEDSDTAANRASGKLTTEGTNYGIGIRHTF
jgi:predicted porin